MMDAITDALSLLLQMLGHLLMRLSGVGSGTYYIWQLMAIGIAVSFLLYCGYRIAAFCRGR